MPTALAASGCRPAAAAVVDDGFVDPMAGFAAPAQPAAPREGWTPAAIARARAAVAAARGGAPTAPAVQAARPYEDEGGGEEDEVEVQPAEEVKLGGLGAGAPAGAPAGAKKKPVSRDDTWQHLQALQQPDWQGKIDAATALKQLAFDADAPYKEGLSAPRPLPSPVLPRPSPARAPPGPRRRRRRDRRADVR